jgi:uncharacterized phage protein gp47/JayE
MPYFGMDAGLVYTTEGYQFKYNEEYKSVEAIVTDESGIEIGNYKAWGSTKDATIIQNRLEDLIDQHIIVDKIDDAFDGKYYYQMECETAGTIGNKSFGEISPIEYIHRDLKGSLVDILIVARDEEDTESLRERYFASLSSSAFGGNKQDYVERTNSIAGVGGTVPIPTWNGGGTVKLLIINSDYNKANTTLIQNVQNEADPSQDGAGLGFAPIGHKVTVDTVTEVSIKISTSITFDEGYSWSGGDNTIPVNTLATQAMEDYLLSKRKAWQKGGLVVRLAEVESRLLNVDGVVDIKDTRINDGTNNITLLTEELPIFGGITNG